MQRRFFYVAVWVSTGPKARECEGRRPREPGVRVEVDGEAKLLAKDDERTSIDDERDIRKMKMARLLETVLTPLFFFFLAMKNVLEWLLELL
jgi:hypothetical protein